MGETGIAVTAASREKAATGIRLEDICSQAWGECRAKLEAALTTFSTYIGTGGQQAHLGAVLNTGSPWGAFGIRAALRLNQIVVGDTYYSNSLSIIERWVTYAGLRLAFQELSNRFAGKDQEDRFEAKRKRYQDMEDRLWQTLFLPESPMWSVTSTGPAPLMAIKPASGTPLVCRR